MVGLSRSTLGKRWDVNEFRANFAPLAWLHDHEEVWAQACADAVTEVRAADDEVSEGRDVWFLLSDLERSAVKNQGDSWQRLIRTPETVRRRYVRPACENGGSHPVAAVGRLG